MSNSIPHRFGKTKVIDVTAASQIAIPLEDIRMHPITFRFIANIGVHIAWGATTPAVPATTEHGLIPTKCIEYITVGPNDIITIIAADGATTGTAWFTEV